MKTIDNFLINSLELPPEILAGMPVITIVGAQSINIENFTKILHFSDFNIIFETGQGNYEICGENLKIGFISQGQIRLTGKISRIFLEEENA